MVGGKEIDLLVNVIRTVQINYITRRKLTGIPTLPITLRIHRRDVMCLMPNCIFT